MVYHRNTLSEFVRNALFDFRFKAVDDGVVQELVQELVVAFVQCDVEPINDTIGVEHLKDVASLPRNPQLEPNAGTIATQGHTG